MSEDSAATDPDAKRAYHAMRDGKLTYQRCRECTYGWLPERSECPHCLSGEIDRLEASGSAKLVSWVVYHRAFVPEFAAMIPYTVGLVELAEGPRLISNIIGVDDPERLVIDQPLRLSVAQQHSAQVPLFTPVPDEGGPEE